MNDTIESLINCLIASCNEGISGTWDASPSGFEAMIIQLEQLKKLLNLPDSDVE